MLSTLHLNILVADWEGAWVYKMIVNVKLMRDSFKKKKKCICL